MKTISVGKHLIGDKYPTFIIAEIAQAHDGSVGIAHSYIDAAADAGVDAVKFQTHIAKHESTLNEPFRTDFSWEDNTRYDYWKRMEFSKEQWKELAEHARNEGLIFLSSAFCKPAVDLLKSIDIPAWKVGSGEYKSKELVSYMAETGSPILLSTGMSKYDEIAEMISTIEEYGTPYALFQCTSKYPSKFESVGLNILDEFSDQFDCPVGLSDHTGSIYPSLAAIARGVDILEVHLTFDRRMFGPDSTASLTVEELETVVQMRDAVHVMDKNPVNKNKMAESLSKTRSLFSKSIATVKELSKGTVLTEDLIEPKKPATGIPYAAKDKVINARLSNDVPPNRLLTWDDLNE